jgi:hypothetical protein
MIYVLIISILLRLSSTIVFDTPIVIASSRACGYKACHEYLVILTSVAGTRAAAAAAFCCEDRVCIARLNATRAATLQVRSKTRMYSWKCLNWMEYYSFDKKDYEDSFELLTSVVCTLIRLRRATIVINGWASLDLEIPPCKTEKHCREGKIFENRATLIARSEFLLNALATYVEVLFPTRERTKERKKRKKKEAIGKRREKILRFKRKFLVRIEIINVVT